MKRLFSVLIVFVLVEFSFGQCTPCPCLSPTPTATSTPISQGLSNAIATWHSDHPTAPFVAFVGDSILEGYPNFVSRADSGFCGTGPCGNAECDIANRLYETSGNLITGTNDGKSGANVAYVYGKAHNISILPPPKYLIFEGGINDIHGTGATFADRQIYYDQAKSLCDSHGSILLVEELWPAAPIMATNAQIVAWNVALNAWATVNGVTVIHMHDWMADPNDNTKIVAAWTTDKTHPSQSGVSRHADAIYNILLQLEGS